MNHYYDVLETLGIREIEERLVGLNEFGRSDLEDLMRYKLARGKWRPRLMKLVSSNSDSECRTITRRAFGQDTKDALLELTKLKGVGPATATYILSTQRDVPPMSDEFVLRYRDKIKYSIPQYLDILADHTKWCNEQKYTLREGERMIWLDARSKKRKRGGSGDH